VLIVVSFSQTIASKISSMATKLTLNDMRSRTGFTLSGEWQDRELFLLDEVFQRYRDAAGFDPWPYPVTILLEKTGINCLRDGKTTCLNVNGLTTWTITHELAHGWDASTGWTLSKRLRKITHSGLLFKRLHLWRPPWKFFWYHVGSPPPPCGVDKNFNAIEDFAESVTAYLYPEEAAKRATERGYPYGKWGYSHFHDTPRGKFIRGLFAE